MTFMDGLELEKETYKYDPKIRIIIFSAYSKFDYAKKALEANNHNNQNDINEKLKVYKIHLEDKYLILINIETRDNFL